MQIPGLPFRVVRRKTRVSKRAHYGLTPLGKIKAEDFKITGARGAVIAAIDDDNSTVQEICDDQRMQPEKVEWIIKKLIREGYVQELRGD